MARQRDAARKAWSGSGEAATEQLWFEIREQHGATEFLGYGTESAEGQVVALVKDGKLVDAVEAGDAVMLIANQTPFYAESGGQMGAAGILFPADGAAIHVTDTPKQRNPETTPRGK